MMPLEALKKFELGESWLPFPDDVYSSWICLPAVSLDTPLA